MQKSTLCSLAPPCLIMQAKKRKLLVTALQGSDQSGAESTAQEKMRIELWLLPPAYFSCRLCGQKGKCSLLRETQEGKQGK